MTNRDLKEIWLIAERARERKEKREKEMREQAIRDMKEEGLKYSRWADSPGVLDWAIKNDEVNWI